MKRPEKPPQCLKCGRPQVRMSRDIRREDLSVERPTPGWRCRVCDRDWFVR